MNLIFIILALIAVLIVVLLLAIFKLREKYMATWIGLAFIVFLFGVFFEQINGFTQVLGFKVYSNFLFLFFGICLGILVFQLSLNLSRQEDKVQSLSEEIALIKLRQTKRNE